jgi:hypothetical protein
MKRIWFAVIFLIICTSLCVGEQVYIKQVYTDLNNKISSAQKYTGTDEMQTAVDNIKKYWDKNNDILFTIADHGVLDDLSAQIRSLNVKDDDIQNNLAQIKALLKVFYENQRVTISNIF